METGAPGSSRGWRGFGWQTPLLRRRPPQAAGGGVIACAIIGQLLAGRGALAIPATGTLHLEYKPSTPFPKNGMLRPRDDYPIEVSGQLFQELVLS